MDKNSSICPQNTTDNSWQLKIEKHLSTQILWKSKQFMLH